MCFVAVLGQLSELDQRDRIVSNRRIRGTQTRLEVSGVPSCLMVGRADVLPVHSTASPTPPQPRTSLLDLSDEIISLVFDQAYRPPSTSPFGVIRLQSIDFLINKRIFELARPLWSKALLIKESQLDSRLAGIHLHKKRRDHLRMLEVPVTNHLYNLLNSVFPRLPLLTHLALQITESASAVSTSTLAEGLIKLVNLEKLRLRSPRHLTPLHDFYHLYLSHKPVKIPHVSLEIGGTPRVTQGLEEGFRCDSYRWTLDLPSTFFRFDWSSLRSLDLRGWAGYLPWADTVLGGIRLAITGNAVRFYCFLLPTEPALTLS